MSPRRNRRRPLLDLKPVLRLRHERCQQRKRRSRILFEYASKDGDVPRVCRLSEEERVTGTDLYGSVGKVIYRHAESAERAALALYEAGARVLEPYACPRPDRSGPHWHLRTKNLPYLQ